MRYVSGTHKMRLYVFWRDARELPENEKIPRVPKNCCLRSFYITTRLGLVKSRKSVKSCEISKSRKCRKSRKSRKSRKGRLRGDFERARLKSMKNVQFSRFSAVFCKDSSPYTVRLSQFSQSLV